MSDDNKHPCVESMLNVIREVLDPNYIPEKDVVEPTTVLQISPEMQLILHLMQMGVPPEELGFKKDEEDT